MESRDLGRYLDIHSTSSILHNSTKVGESDPSIHRQTDEQTGKTWSIHTPDYPLSQTWRDTLTPAPAWTDLGEVMLSEIRQNKGTNTAGFHTHTNSLESPDPQGQRMDEGSWGQRWGGRLVSHGDRISVWEDGKFWRLTVGTTAPSLNPLNAPERCI